MISSTVIHQFSVHCHVAENDYIEILSAVPQIKPSTPENDIVKRPIKSCKIYFILCINCTRVETGYGKILVARPRSSPIPELHDRALK